MDRPGVRQVPEGSGEQGKIEKTGCKIICCAPTTLAVKGLMMMMMTPWGSVRVVHTVRCADVVGSVSGVHIARCADVVGSVSGVHTVRCADVVGSVRVVHTALQSLRN